MKLGDWHLPRGLGRIARPVRRLVTARDGAEAIEFALVSIPLVLFLMGVVEFGRLYWTQSELQYAAEATARCATTQCCASLSAECGGSTTTDASGLQSFAVSQLLGMSVPSTKLSDFQLTAAGCGNLITFNYQFSFIVSALFPYVITLSTSACHQA